MNEQATGRRFPRSALLTVPAILGVGLLMGQIANSGYGNPWFDALAKPGIMPPGWAFGAAWTILYILLGLALALILQRHGATGRGRALALFGAQLALNYSWSPIFFRFHEIGMALVIILTMLVLSVAATLAFWRIRPLAGWLMLPYLAWLTFAAILNYRILELNPGA